MNEPRRQSFLQWVLCAIAHGFLVLSMLLPAAIAGAILLALQIVLLKAADPLLDRWALLVVVVLGVYALAGGIILALLRLGLRLSKAPAPLPDDRRSFFAIAWARPWLVAVLHVFAGGCFTGLAASLGAPSLLGVASAFEAMAVLAALRGSWLIATSSWRLAGHSQFYGGAASVFAVALLLFQAAEASRLPRASADARQVGGGTGASSSAGTREAERIYALLLGTLSDSGAPTSRASADAAGLPAPGFMALGEDEAGVRTHGDDPFSRCVTELFEPAGANAPPVDQALLQLRQYGVADPRDVVSDTVLAVCNKKPLPDPVALYFYKATTYNGRRAARIERRCERLDVQTCQLPAPDELPEMRLSCAARWALCQLASDDRQIIQLHIDDGLDFDEIARLLKVEGKAPARAASQRYYRALKSLRAAMPPGYEPPANRP